MLAGRLDLLAASPSSGHAKSSTSAPGTHYDDAVIESFCGRVQIELLNRRRWKTRIELANALFECLEVFHNRRRRHSALGMLTPIEYEKLYATATA